MVVLVMDKTDMQIVIFLKFACRSQCFLEATGEMTLKHVSPAQKACAKGF